MPFFKRGKNSGQDVDLSNDASTPSANPKSNENGDEEKNEISLARTKTEDIVYPTGVRLALLMISVFISSMYLSAGR